MALAMTRPWKHPGTNIYWLRKRIPKDLLAVLGKREEKRSLGTRDPAEAKRRLAEVLLEVETRWAALRAKPNEGVSKPATKSTLSEREAHERAEWLYGHWLQKYRDNPSEQRFWRTNLFDLLWPEESSVEYGHGDDVRIALPTQGQIQDEIKAAELRTWCLAEADLLLEIRDLVVDEASRLKLAKALAAAAQRASLRLERWAKGEFDNQHVSDHHRDQMSRQSRAGEAASAPVTFQAIFDGWAAEKRPVERTLYEWRRVLRELSVFLGHDDARKVSADDLIAWKSRLVEVGRQPKTIRDGKLAPVRAILQWGVDNRRLASNPAERVTIETRQKPGEKIRSFNDEEAALILSSAVQQSDPVRRWVPWLCAYSGARVSEICQLRSQDILQVEAVWVMKIDPDAGSLKNRNSERMVPLHPALIDGGFLTFASGISSGPLFSNLSPDKFGKRGGNGTKVLGRWVRSLGLSDPRLSPNHSWRHRFKTSGRRFGLAPDLLDAITGHAHRTVADGYGEYPMEALSREMRRIPTIEV